MRHASVCACVLLMALYRFNSEGTGNFYEINFYACSPSPSHSATPTAHSYLSRFCDGLLYRRCVERAKFSGRWEKMRITMTKIDPVPFFLLLFSFPSNRPESLGIPFHFIIYFIFSAALLKYVCLYSLLSMSIGCAMVCVRCSARGWPRENVTESRTCDDRKRMTIERTVDIEQLPYSTIGWLVHVPKLTQKIIFALLHWQTHATHKVMPYYASLGSK